MQTVEEVANQFFRQKEVTNPGEYACVISTKEAKRGCQKKISSGLNQKTIRIPAGCKNGQILEGIKIYVHDFSPKEQNLEKLPNAVLSMYANKSNGILMGNILSFVFWLIFAMATEQFFAMSVGMIVSFIFVLGRGIARRKVINSAKSILANRQSSTKS